VINTGRLRRFLHPFGLWPAINFHKSRHPPNQETCASTKIVMHVSRDVIVNVATFNTVFNEHLPLANHLHSGATHLQIRPV
jgi:hypothetical protein